MVKSPTVIKIHSPDDFHVHLRDGEIMRTVLPYTSRYFNRAIIMPNLIPPITTLNQAIAYRKRIIEAIPTNHQFLPLMTCYLTDSLDKETLINGYLQNIFIAAKLYPKNTTTNSQTGVTNISNIYHLFEVMQNINMPLLIHGELAEDYIDIFDREARFIEQIMYPIRQRFPALRIVFEHISTKEAVDYVLAGDEYLSATITPQHLIFNRNHMLSKGIKPHLYCSPILKSKIHQQSLRTAIASGCDRLFLGTDTAPHVIKNKESQCGSAGIFSSPTALLAYISVFEEMGALAYFESFCSFNGQKFYTLPINNNFIEFRREKSYQSIISIGKDSNEYLIPFLSGKVLNWKVITDIDK